MKDLIPFDFVKWHHCLPQPAQLLSNLGYSKAQDLQRCAKRDIILTIHQSEQCKANSALIACYDKRRILVMRILQRRTKGAAGVAQAGVTG
ncbi:MAG TPA: hypothetical protein VKB76_11125 [Ktedonobacterales bacterium]|nr:hypothetical protein [Ktedonobacterales bacterium]